MVDLLDTARTEHHILRTFGDFSRNETTKGALAAAEWLGVTKDETRWRAYLDRWSEDAVAADEKEAPRVHERR